MHLGLAEFSGSGTMVDYTTAISKCLIRRDEIDQISIFVPESFNVGGINDRNINILSFDYPESSVRAFLSSGNLLRVNKIAELIRKSGVETLHILNEMRAPVSLVYKLRDTVQVVITVHEPYAYVPTFLRKLVLNKIQNWNTYLLCKLSDEICVHGNHSERILESTYDIDASRIHQYPHGSYIDKFDTDSNINYNQEQNSVLFFGRIFPGKGVEYFVDAANIVQEQMPNTTFIISGSGDLENNIKSDQSLDNIVIKNYFIPADEVKQLFKQATIVVLPYSHGSQSGVLGIAGGFGKPVVATDVGNFSSYVIHNKTGILVPPEDSSSIAEGILDLLKDKQKGRMLGNNAKQLYENEWSWTQSAKTLVTVYD